MAFMLFSCAAMVGIVHAAASLYWAFGGHWLLGTVGQFAVQMQENGGSAARWSLGLIGVAKIVAAVAPVLDHWRNRPHAWIRGICWLGATVLLLWGGLGTIGGWIGLVSDSSGSDRSAQWGHACLWDPLFVAWAVLLIGGLVATRDWRSVSD